MKLDAYIKLLLKILVYFYLTCIFRENLILPLSERNSKLDAELLDKYANTYGSDLLEIMWQGKDFTLDYDNSFIKFNDCNEKDIKYCDTYSLRDGEELLNLLSTNNDRIKFSYDL